MCLGGLGAASSTWCCWDTCPGSSWSSGYHCGVSAACGHSHFLQTPGRGLRQGLTSLPQFPPLVRPPELSLGACSLFKYFPHPKHHFLVAFLDAPGTGNCPQGNPGMKLP